jgi:acyl carrier protein
MTDNYENTLQRICKHLERIAGPGAVIRADTNLVDEFALDSVKILDLIMEIEDEFDISIPLNLMAEVQLVSDLARMIERIESEK